MYRSFPSLCIAVVARLQALQAGSGDVGVLPLRWEELYQFSRQLLCAPRRDEAVARLGSIEQRVGVGGAPSSWIPSTRGGQARNSARGARGDNELHLIPGFGRAKKRVKQQPAHGLL